MTFYDNDLVNSVPDLPRYEYALDDSPSCHQSLKYWSTKAGEIAPTLSNLASSVESYYESGVTHHQSGIDLSTALGDVAKQFQADAKISEPIAKFSDVLQRIECYRDMLLNQTHLLMWEPLKTLAKEYEKAKELHAQTLKARDDMHLAWERFASCSHTVNMQEPSMLDKFAHGMFHARQHYQRMLLKYVATLKEIHTLKKTLSDPRREQFPRAKLQGNCELRGQIMSKDKYYMAYFNTTMYIVVVLQKVLEHMLAQFSFFNFGYQTLKDIEPYMNDLFQELHDRHSKAEQSLKCDEEIQMQVEKDIVFQQQRDAQAFGEPQQPPAALGQSVSAMNAQAGKFFNRIGDLFQSSSLALSGNRKSMKGSSSQSAVDQEWEFIDPTQSSSKEKTCDGQDIERPSSLHSSPEKRSRTQGRGEALSPKKEASLQFGEDASLLSKESESQDKVINVVPQDLLSPIEKPHSTAGSTTEISLNSESIPSPSLASMKPSEWEGCKKGYLRIRQKAFPKSRWPLLYFIVDKKSGSFLAQGQEQVQPSTLESLLLCTVKISDATDADRNYCFQLISPSSDRVFQALTDQEVQEWISAIQEATADALRNSKAKLVSLARSRLDSVPKKEPKCLVLNAAERIRKVDGNKYCADCSCPRPDWASINLGITVCIECSGVHRSMGVHVSKVRSLTLDKWDDATVEFMEAMGNTKANKIFEGNLGDYFKPTRDSSKHDRQKFIKLKYMEQMFYEQTAVELDPELADVMTSRPGDREEELLDLSGEIFDQDDRSLMGSSPLCLVEDCEECGSISCTHKGHFVAPQLIVSDSSGEEEKDGEGGVEDESQC